MGNSHPNSSIRRKTLGRQRRLSDPSQKNYISNPENSTPHTSHPAPTIQINGETSFDDSQDPMHQRSNSVSTDFMSFSTNCTPIISKKSNSASERRKIFLSSSSNQSAARSLDESMTAKMSSLVRAKSHSPLKQMRTYSFRSISSEENLIDKQCGTLILNSWRVVVGRASALERGACFGCFVLRRVFAKIPPLCALFGLAPGQDLMAVEENDAARRHARLLTNILHIAVNNVDELEQQVAPIAFKYGERHYRPDITANMTEENVRIFCAQIVCTVFDFLEDSETSPKCVESWIELMRYIGQKLLDGHEFAKLSAEKKISINRNDHHLFLML